MLLSNPEPVDELDFADLSADIVQGDIFAYMDLLVDYTQKRFGSVSMLRPYPIRNQRLQQILDSCGLSE